MTYAEQKRAATDAHRQRVLNGIARVMERAYLAASPLLTDRERQDVEATAVVAVYQCWLRETGALDDEARQRRIMERATEIAQRVIGERVETERIAT